jgi:hypothetical protein
MPDFCTKCLPLNTNCQISQVIGEHWRRKHVPQLGPIRKVDAQMRKARFE